MRISQEQIVVNNLRAEWLARFRKTVSAWKGTKGQKAKRLGLDQARLGRLLNHDDNYDLEHLLRLNIRANKISNKKNIVSPADLRNWVKAAGLLK